VDEYNWTKIAISIISGLISLHFGLRKNSPEYRAIWRKVRRTYIRLNESSRIAWP
jgi:hypothetical protein